MDSGEDQEDQAQNRFRGCQIGACFACSLGVRSRLLSDNSQRGGNTKISEWQSSRPNPLPMFEFPDNFYTPMLLPGMYLPLEFMSRQIDEESPFHIIENPELAECLAAFLSHETDHRHLLVGIIPTLMRLLASRCYTPLALLITQGFHPSWWGGILSQSSNIEELYLAIAPFHEVVANLCNLSVKKDYSYAAGIAQNSIASYTKAYGEEFTKILSDFSFILQSLENWFAPSPLQQFTVYILAEFILLGTIDTIEILADLMTAPPLMPIELLADRIARVGLIYFDTDRQSPNPLIWKLFRYNIYSISGRLEEIVLGIKNAKPKRSKKPLKTYIDQLLYIAKVIPGSFQEWLQSMDKLPWLKRRILYGISDMQEMIKNIGFDLPLIEAWQSDMSPHITITLPNKSTGKVKCFAYGSQRKNFLYELFSHLDEPHQQQMMEYYWSSNLIAFNLQFNRTLGVWYTPSCDEVNHIPITPKVLVMSQDTSLNRNLAVQMFDLTVFESLREQVASGRGMSCLLRHQYGNDCCGKSTLHWGIYEAGLKAIEELGWQPTQWVEPECSKPGNS